MIWWTSSQVLEPVHVHIKEKGRAHFTVYDDGLASIPEDVRSAEEAWAAAQQRVSWYNRMGLLTVVVS